MAEPSSRFVRDDGCSATGERDDGGGHEPTNTLAGHLHGRRRRRTSVREPDLGAQLPPLMAGRSRLWQDSAPTHDSCQVALTATSAAGYSRHTSPTLPLRIAGGTMTEPRARRRKIVALVLSGVFPGLGQFYNRQPIKGVVFLGAGIVLSWVLGRAVPTDPHALAQTGAALIVLLCVVLALWLWSIVDAWRIAGR